MVVSRSLVRLLVVAALSPLAVAACSSAPPTDEEVAQSTAEALTGDDAVSRAEDWVAVKLHYCQAPNHKHDYDAACSSTCNRYSNPQWDPYRSDCSGLVSWAWGLPAPGRVTTQFAPFQTDISKAISAIDLAPGDAVNNSEHVMLFKKWVTKGKSAVFIEEPGCSVSTPYAHELTSNVSLNGSSIYVSYEGASFTAIHYKAMQPPNTAPRGYLDAADCTALAGWAQDQDTPDKAISVDLYFDAKAGGTGGSGSLRTTANQSRADLCKNIGSCDHGYSVAPPRSLRDGKKHTVYAYGIDSSGKGPNPMLSAAPKSFTCDPPAPPFPPGVKRWVKSVKVAGAWNIDLFTDVAPEPPALVDTYPRGDDLPAAPVVVQADDGTPEVWVVDGPERRHVINPASLKAWGFTVTPWPAAKVQALTQGPDWPAKPFALRAAGNPAVYVLDVAAPSTDPGGPLPGNPGSSGAAPGDPQAGATGCSAAPGSASASSGLWLLAALALVRRKRSPSAR